MLFQNLTPGFVSLSYQTEITVCVFPNDKIVTVVQVTVHACCLRINSKQTVNMTLVALDSFTRMQVSKQMLNLEQRLRLWFWEISILCPWSYLLTI